MFYLKWTNYSHLLVRFPHLKLLALARNVSLRLEQRYASDSELYALAFKLCIIFTYFDGCDCLSDCSKINCAVLALAFEADFLL